MKILAIHGGCGTFKEQIENVCSSSLKSTAKKREREISSNAKNNDEEKGSRLVQAIMELEKCPSLNCGIGSNLTQAGTVECEAAFMCSTNLAFGAVASVSNCVYPIYAAAKLADSNRSQNSSSTTQLIEPMILVGPGANEYCSKLMGNNVDGIVKNEQLITEAAKKEFNRAKSIIVASNANNPSSSIGNGEDLRLDTVGGVLIDLANGYAEAGISSGGILLKKCGRLGHSSHFGAGIWAEHRDHRSISISLSGCGEAIIRTQMAEKLSQFTFQSDLDDPFLPEYLKNFLDVNFLNSPRLSAFPRNRLILGGLLLIKNGVTVELLAFHNSRHFPFAFMKSDGKIAKLKSQTDKCGEFVCISLNL